MFRKIMLAAALASSFVLSGCITTDPNAKSILQGGPSITAKIDNPITSQNPYQARLSLNLAVKAANRWASYCWRRPYTQIMADPIASPICQNRRSVRTSLLATGEKADRLIKRASDFVRDNPKVSAVSLIDDAWAAVNEFRGQIPALPAN
jgi:hypothetical protein